MDNLETQVALDTR